MNVLEAARWILGSLSLIAGAYVSGVNAYILLRYLRRSNAPSWIPLIGGILGAIGLLILPTPSLRAAWWIPFFLDWGSVPGITHAVAWHLLRRNREKDVH